LPHAPMGCTQCRAAASQVRVSMIKQAAALFRTFTPACADLSLCMTLCSSVCMQAMQAQHAPQAVDFFCSGMWVMHVSLPTLTCCAASCTGPVTVTNGNCATTLSGQTCTGSCNSGFSGSPVATCTNGVYTVSGSCQPGKTMGGFPLSCLCILICVVCSALQLLYYVMPSMLASKTTQVVQLLQCQQAETLCCFALPFRLCCSLMQWTDHSH
jgi:hypothetical protein